MATASPAEMSTSNGSSVCVTASTSIPEVSLSLYKLLEPSETTSTASAEKRRYVYSPAQTPLHLHVPEDIQSALLPRTVSTSDESIWGICENDHERVHPEDMRGTATALQSRRSPADSDPILPDSESQPQSMTNIGKIGTCPSHSVPMY